MFTLFLDAIQIILQRDKITALELHGSTGIYSMISYHLQNHEKRHHDYKWQCQEKRESETKWAESEQWLRCQYDLLLSCFVMLPAVSLLSRRPIVVLKVHYSRSIFGNHKSEISFNRLWLHSLSKWIRFSPAWIASWRENMCTHACLPMPCTQTHHNTSQFNCGWFILFVTSLLFLQIPCMNLVLPEEASNYEMVVDALRMAVVFGGSCCHDLIHK